MSKPMTAFTTDFQHSGMVAKDLDETIASTPRSSALRSLASSTTARTAAPSCVTAT